MFASAKIDELKVELLHPAAKLPARAHPGDAGYDLHCVNAFKLASGERAVIPTGIALALPGMVAGLILPRSGLAARNGLSVVNGPGLVDPNYRGEICVILVNLGAEPFSAASGDRIAQLLLVPYVSPVLVAVAALPSTNDGRGENGFGSTGR